MCPRQVRGVNSLAQGSLTRFYPRNSFVDPFSRKASPWAGARS